MQISRDQLARLIPHAGAMCLLDGVLTWSDAEIACTASSHRDPHNPMLRNGLLHAVCGIEYVSQAMAAHGALINPFQGAARQGYLAGLRNFALHAGRLDLIAGALLVQARQVVIMNRNSLYDFSIMAEGKTIMAGRAAVALDGGER